MFRIPSGNPPVVAIDWPKHTTIVQPAQFAKVANEIASLLAMASTRFKSDPDPRAMNRTDWTTTLLVACNLALVLLVLTGQIR